MGVRVGEVNIHIRMKIRAFNIFFVNISGITVLDRFIGVQIPYEKCYGFIIQ